MVQFCVNTTNICILACRFCAFRKGPRHNDAYALSVEEYLHRIEPFSEIIDEVHSVGGLHPDWDIEYYENLYYLVNWSNNLEFWISKGNTIGRCFGGNHFVFF